MKDRNTDEEKNKDEDTEIEVIVSGYYRSPADRRSKQRAVLFAPRTGELVEVISNRKLGNGTRRLICKKIKLKANPEHVLVLK